MSNSKNSKNFQFGNFQKFLFLKIIKFSLLTNLKKNQISVIIKFATFQIPKTLNFKYHHTFRAFE